MLKFSNIPWISDGKRPSWVQDDDLMMRLGWKSSAKDCNFHRSGAAYHFPTDHPYSICAEYNAKHPDRPQMVPWNVAAFYTNTGTPEERTWGQIVNNYDYGVGVIDEKEAPATQDSLSYDLDAIAHAVNFLRNYGDAIRDMQGERDNLRQIVIEAGIAAEAYHVAANKCVRGDEIVHDRSLTEAANDFHAKTYHLRKFAAALNPKGEAQ